ncbi:MAG: phosphoadenosine phosphosulfate reductase family protein, partial [Gemmatimonadetes bacterium]|nr:phosphoadenosine phosphosulfate reductase family protein [Gemmatimonadota bacterium]
MPRPNPLEDGSRARRPGRHRAGSWLAALESEAIEIIREGVATAARPLMLYSIGKDSSVLLHLARKSFWPAGPPPRPARRTGAPGGTAGGAAGGGRR